LQDPNAELHERLSRGDLAGAPLSEPERALLTFVKLVTESAYKTTEGDVEALRAQGWTDPQIAECVYVTALFAFFNRVADAFGIEDPGYFANPPAHFRGPGGSTPAVGPDTTP
jgi:alkylhydroperoxidase family enzyme